MGKQVGWDQLALASAGPPTRNVANGIGEPARPESRWSHPAIWLSLFFCVLSLPLFAADDKPKDVNFDDIKFEMKKGDPFERSMLTEGIEKLHNKPIKIRGYMLPSFQQKGITQFVLVRDNMECCFGPGAALFDCILVEMVEGQSTSFTVKPIAVEGVFKISEFLGPDGKHLAIYHLDGKAVK